MLERRGRGLEEDRVRKREKKRAGNGEKEEDKRWLEWKKILYCSDIPHSPVYIFKTDEIYKGMTMIYVRLE